MSYSEEIKKTKERVEKRKKEFPLEWLGRSLAYNNYPPRDILPYITACKEKPYRFICKIDAKEDAINILSKAQSYERAGVDAICVDTSNIFDVELITNIRRYVATPILQKDCIVDEYQLVESVVYGADCVELIAKIFSTKELKKMFNYAKHLGLEVLVIVDDKEDLTKAILAGALLIGLKDNNYKTFIPLIPNGKVIVCEGNFESKEAIKNAALDGVDAFMLTSYAANLL